MIGYKFHKTGKSVLLIGIIAQSQTKAEFHSCAPKRPMESNSRDCFEPAVIEAEGKAHAGYMAECLNLFGWNYIMIDKCLVSSRESLPEKLTGTERVCLKLSKYLNS